MFWLARSLIVRFDDPVRLQEKPESRVKQNPDECPAPVNQDVTDEWRPSTGQELMELIEHADGHCCRKSKKGSGDRAITSHPQQMH